ncbi:MAG TPA: hypothetical protein VMT97_17450 [Terriglobales bacterium]|nr:hypothetical protein [Terriglobales bacterium]
MTRASHGWPKLNTITEGAMASQSTHAQLAAIQEFLRQIDKQVREISLAVKSKKK